METTNSNITNFKDSNVIDFNDRKRKYQRRVRTKEDRKQAFDDSVTRLKRAVEKDGGRYIEFEDRSTGTSVKGILLAGVSVNKKLYFAFMDKNRIIRKAYHGDTYRLIREIPIEFSVIDYIYRHDYKEFKALVEAGLDATGWELLTNVQLREPRYKKSEQRQRKGSKSYQGKKRRHTNKNQDKK